MKITDFPPGTRFFVDEGYPVSVSPRDGESSEVTNWMTGEGKAVTSAEILRKTFPTEITYDVFENRVAQQGLIFKARLAALRAKVEARCAAKRLADPEGWEESRADYFYARPGPDGLPDPEL